MRLCSRAVTLPELLVVIAIIAVLLGIAIPALSHAHRQTQATDRLAEFRSITMGFVAIASTDSDRLPVLTDPKEPVTIAAPADDSGDTARVENVKYFDDLWYWHLPLARELLGLPWHHEVFSRSTNATGLATDILYNRAFYAAPEYFTYTQRSQTETDQWIPQRLFNVRYPSDKSILAEGPSADETGTRTRNSQALSFVDGSAAFLRPEDIRDGFPPGVFGHPNASDLLVFGLPGVVTTEGIYGRDR